MGRKYEDRERSNSIEILDERYKAMSAIINISIDFFIFKFYIRVITSKFLLKKFPLSFVTESNKENCENSIRWTV